MDLNQLLRAHQIAKMGEASTKCRAARADHADAMAHLAICIRELRAEAGADVSAGPFVAGEPIAEYRDR